MSEGGRRRRFDHRCPMLERELHVFARRLLMNVKPVNKPAKQPARTKTVARRKAS